MFHDAVELFMHLALEHHDPRRKRGRVEFMEYFTLLSLTGRTSIDRLNTARVVLKHAGLPRRSPRAECASAPGASPPGEVRSAAAPAASPGEPPAPVRQVLPNGLRLITQDHRASNIVAIHLWAGLGVRYEKPDELGYSPFMEHGLFKGTDTWGPGYLDRAVEGVAAAPMPSPRSTTRPSI